MDEAIFRPIAINPDDVVDLNVSIDSITAEIKEHKTKIREYLNTEQSIDIKQLSDDCSSLLEQSKNTTDLVIEFENNIRDQDIHDISNTTDELEKLISEVSNVELSLGIVEQLIECDSLLKEYKNLKRENNSNKAVAVLSDATHLLNNPNPGLEHLELFKAMKVALVLNWEELLNELSELWGTYISWHETSVDDKKTIVMKIQNTQFLYYDALVHSKQIHIELKKMCTFLLDHVLYEIIHCPATLKNYDNDSHNHLEIVLSLKKKEKPHYESVLNNLKIVFDYLSSNLQFENEDGSCFISMIGDIICYDFSDSLIKECLVHTIPNCISELQDYGKVTSQVEDFQMYLTSIRFLQSENFSILQYANNIDVLFANKTSQYFLENARAILKKDLSNTMSVGVDFKNNDASLSVEKFENYEIFSAFFKSFKISPYRFPLCAVSRSIQELLDLVIVMMEQATEASDMCARRLYYTARNVFELYLAIVPLHHKSLLESMPQQVALFHNNCMYLAHHLLTLGPKWIKTLAGRELNYLILFCDLVKELRDLATHTLLNHMRIQKKQLLDTIRSSDLYYIATKDVLSENAEQAIRQCIRQLQVLKTVWSGLFPADIYKRLITCLAEVFIDELILKVVVQEDITADVATQLTDLYKIVLNRLPQVYLDDADIYKNVPSWTRFSELILVLGGTLANIEERWFNGTGPLAMQFKADEIKRLIRALFQNTTFRANLLSKIK